MSLYSKLNSSNPEEFFPELLQIIGGILNVSRCYIFEYCENTDSISNTYEWTQPGIKPQKEKLQDIPVKLISFWHEHMTNNQNIVFFDVNNIPSFPENQFLIEQGIKSILVVPIHINNKYYGFLGIDECRYKRSWSELEIAFMQAMAVFIRKWGEKPAQLNIN